MGRFWQAVEVEKVGYWRSDKERWEVEVVGLALVIFVVSGSEKNPYQN